MSIAEQKFMVDAQGRNLVEMPQNEFVFQFSKLQQIYITNNKNLKNEINFLWLKLLGFQKKQMFDEWVKNMRYLRPYSTNNNTIVQFKRINKSLLSFETKIQSCKIIDQINYNIQQDDYG